MNTLGAKNILQESGVQDWGKWQEMIDAILSFIATYKMKMQMFRDRVRKLELALEIKKRKQEDDAVKKRFYQDCLNIQDKIPFYDTECDSSLNFGQTYKYDEDYNRPWHKKKQEPSAGIENLKRKSAYSNKSNAEGDGSVVDQKNVQSTQKNVVPDTQKDVVEYTEKNVVEVSEKTEEKPTKQKWFLKQSKVKKNPSHNSSMGDHHEAKSNFCCTHHREMAQRFEDRKPNVF